MKTIAQNKEFKIEFNGSSTYMIVDNCGTCWKAVSSERKALNYFNKVSTQCGVI